jgi:hypothetical protein
MRLALGGGFKRLLFCEEIYVVRNVRNPQMYIVVQLFGVVTRWRTKLSPGFKPVTEFFFMVGQNPGLGVLPGHCIFGGISCKIFLSDLK